MINNYLVMKNNTHPCMRLKIDKDKNSAILEMSSVEESHRFLKSECNLFIVSDHNLLELRILGQNCRINRVGDNPFGITMNMQKLVNNAEVNFLFL